MSIEEEKKVLNKWREFREYQRNYHHKGGHEFGKGPLINFLADFKVLIQKCEHEIKMPGTQASLAIKDVLEALNHGINDHNNTKLKLNTKSYKLVMEKFDTIFNYLVKSWKEEVQSPRHKETKTLKRSPTYICLINKEKKGEFGIENRKNCLIDLFKGLAVDRNGKVEWNFENKNHQTAPVYF